MLRALLLTVLLILPRLTSAQYTFTGGPADGGTIHDFIEHNGHWFIAHETFLLRSVDEGQTWEILSDGLPATEISPRALAEFDGYLYLSTNSEHRMLRSADGGTTWEKFNAGLPTFFGITTYLAREMVVSGNRLIALPLGNDFIRYVEEGGTAWAESPFNGAAGNGIRALGDTLMASIDSNIRFSTDHGDTWTNIPENPIPSISFVGATDFLKIGERVLITTNAGGNNGVAYSDANLSGWTLPEGNFYSGNAGGPKFVYISDDHILALAANGIMKSTDQGSSWQEITTENTRPNGVTTFIEPLPGDRVLVGSTSGLYLYPNHGEGEPRLIDIPLGEVNIFDTFAFDGGLIAQHSGRVSTYSHETNAWIRRLDMRDIGFSINSTNAGAHRIDLLGERIVLFNQDRAVISAPGTTAATLDSTSFSEMTTLGDIVPITMHAFDDTWLIVGGIRQIESFGIFFTGTTLHRSTDAGATWQEVTHDIPSGALSRAPYFKGAKTVVHNNKWYLSSERGFLRSDDEGQNWTRIDQGSRVVLFSFDGALFMSSSDDFGHTIMKSTDDGDTWVTWHDGLPTTNTFSRRTHGLVQIDDVLYTYNDARASITPEPGETGLFEITSAGDSWSLVEGHPLMPFRPNLMLASNGYIMGIQPKAGYWRSPLVGSPTSVEWTGTAMAVRAELTGNYPNPFNPSTTIRYTVHESSVVQVRIFNVLGQQVFESAATLHTPGSHGLSFNAAGLSSGLYLYRLEVNGTGVDSRTMMLVK
ncbi:MAG: extracellular GH74 family glycosyl hydrolase [Bacteroidetes bacterium HLUCCA01]|nr:MAG: extracellular GH74 family glycosyl hydrolase [Bacteroidetes bacterium HLUCCA01]